MAPIIQNTWTRKDPQTEEEFMISSVRAWLSIPFIQTAFESSEMSWAKKLSDRDMKTMLDSSETFGLYAVAKEDVDAKIVGTARFKQIGMARLVTDRVTIAYITDVYVHNDFKKRGLGKWLAECCQGYIDGFGDAFRRSMLITSTTFAIPVYAKLNGMHVVSKETDDFVVMTGKRGDKVTPDGLTVLPPPEPEESAKPEDSAKPAESTTPVEPTKPGESATNV